MERSVYEEFREPPPRRLGQISDPSLLPVAETEQLPPVELSAKELAMWRWANVGNLDVFLQEVYQYFLDKGFWCILLSRALSMATVLFVVTFSTYLCSCIDYSRLGGARTLADIRVQHCLANTSKLHKLVLWLFGAVWFAKCFQYVSDVRRLWELHDFYLHSLGISENEIQTISWQQVVDRIVQLRSTNLAAGRPHHHTRRPLDAHGIVNRIMRKENYMIALYNRNNVLDLNVTLPLVGEYQFLTKTLEWSLSVCIVDYVFNERGHLRPAFLNEAKRSQLAQGLRTRLQFAAIMNILLAPAAVVYMTLYYFFRYFNDYKSNPSTLGTRQYTPLAEWRLRELNELYHLFRRRLSMSEEPAKRYISQFPREKTELVLRFVAFIASAFVAVLVTLSLWDPALIQVEIQPDKTVEFYIITLGLVIAVARGMFATEAHIYQPEAAMRQIVEFTHYLPEQWEGRLHTEQTKNEFCDLYDLKPKIILRDLLSVFLNPAILGIRLAARSERIVDFFREFSIHVDDLGGYVCSFAVFNNLDNASNNANSAKNTKSKAELERYYATADGKMLKSYLNFLDVYGPPSRRKPANYSQAAMMGGSIDASTSAMSNSVMGHFDRLRHHPQAPNGALSQLQLEAVTEQPSPPSFGTGMDNIGAGDTPFNGVNTGNGASGHGTGASTGTGNGTISSDLNMLESDNDEDEDDALADRGVLGLLNNLYKADGRPAR